MPIFTKRNINSCLVSQKGPAHAQNEDHGYQNDRYSAYAVADGIGGLPAAATASEIAISRFANEVEQLNKSPKPWEEKVIHTLFTCINDSVLSHGQNISDCHGMGTTFSGLIAENEDRWWLIHAGDSRIYGMTSARITQLTTDQTLYTERQQMGLPVDSTSDRATHVLTNYVGSPSFSPTVRIINPRQYAALILCTDGLCKK